MTIRRIARTDADRALDIALDKMIREMEVTMENERAADNADRIIEIKPDIRCS